MKDRKSQGDQEPQDRQEPMDPSPSSKITSKRGQSGARLGRDVQAKIGQQLRSYYDGLIEPPPERFTELLRRLDKTGDKGSSE